MKSLKSKSLLIATLATTALCVACIGCNGTDQSEPTNENTTNYEWHIVIAENGLSKELLLEVGQHYQELIGHRAAPNSKEKRFGTTEKILAIITLLLVQGKRHVLSSRLFFPQQPEQKKIVRMQPVFSSTIRLLKFMP